MIPSQADASTALSGASETLWKLLQGIYIVGIDIAILIKV
jgi:hypothetical protein